MESAVGARRPSGRGAVCAALLVLLLALVHTAFGLERSPAAPPDEDRCAARSVAAAVTDPPGPDCAAAPQVVVPAKSRGHHRGGAAGTSAVAAVLHQARGGPAVPGSSGALMHSMVEPAEWPLAAAAYRPGAARAPAVAPSRTTVLRC